MNSVKFHLFEANESLIKTIEKSTTLYNQSTFLVNHACISDKSGYSKFYLESKQSGQSHVATNQEDGLAIKNLVLDQYCRGNGINKIDFAKIDLEGHELAALKGWKTFLKDHTVLAIYIEIMPENQKRYGLETKAPLFYLESLDTNCFYVKKKILKILEKNPKIINLSQGLCIYRSSKPKTLKFCDRCISYNS